MTSTNGYHDGVEDLLTSLMDDSDNQDTFSFDDGSEDECPAPAQAVSNAGSYPIAPDVNVHSSPVAQTPPSVISPKVRTNSRLRRSATPARITEKPATQRRSATAGGRWKLLAFRYVILAAVLMIVVSGIKSILTPPASIEASVKSQVLQQLGGQGFPAQQAEAVAVRYASSYLNFSQPSAQVRAASLQPYLPSQQTTIGSSAGWNGSGSQSLIAGPIPAGIQVQNSTNAIVTVAAETNQNRWLYLAIGVRAGNGGAVVTGLPAFVPPPPKLNVSTPTAIQPDQQVTAAMQPILNGFFAAWGASSPSLPRYLAPQASLAAQAGLSGALTEANVSNISVPPGGSTRTLTCQVTWNVPGGGQLTQDYQVQIELVAGSWSIVNVQGGVIDPTGQGS